MKKPMNEFNVIVKIGGNLSISSKNIGDKEIIDIANIAKNSSSKLIIRDADKLKYETLESLCNILGDKVTLDF